MEQQLQLQSSQLAMARTDAKRADDAERQLARALTTIQVYYPLFYHTISLHSHVVRNCMVWYGIVTGSKSRKSCT